MARVRVVGDREKAYALLQVSSGRDLVVEVMDDRNIECRRACIHPIFAELITMPRVYWLYGISQIAKYTHKGFKGPAFAALCFPPPTVVLKGPKRDEGVVGRAASEHFRP